MKGILLLLVHAVFSLTFLTFAARASEPTAFALAKEGDRYVGEQSKDKIVQIRSDKSVGSLTPKVWYVVYYDPDATLKSVEVKFVGGEEQKVKRPMRLLEPVTGEDTPLDRAKLKVDSDQALKAALAEPVLKDIKVTATQFKLERVGQGVLGREGPGEAVWRIKLWAAKLRNPNHDADIGEIWVSATDGKVVRNTLHIEHLG